MVLRVLKKQPWNCRHVDPQFEVSGGNSIYIILAAPLIVELGTNLTFGQQPKVSGEKRKSIRELEERMKRPGEGKRQGIDR